MSEMISPIKSIRSGSVFRQAFAGDQPAALTDIYRDAANIAIWQRRQTKELAQAAAHVVITMPKLQAAATVSPASVGDHIADVLGNADEVVALKDDIVQLVEMFCCLFELEKVGLRIAVLDQAMCPRFHVDRVPCRLVTTYQGIATEWLSHDSVDRSKLGTGNEGMPDEQSGLFASADDIQSLKNGDVALLKGELWQGNENAGLVHRSPRLRQGQSRLLLTMDFAE